MSEYKTYKITTKNEPFQITHMHVVDNALQEVKGKWWGSLDEIFFEMFGIHGVDSKFNSSIKLLEAEPTEAIVLADPWGFSVLRCRFGRQHYNIEEVKE